MQPGVAPEKAPQPNVTTITIELDANGNIIVDKPQVTLLKSHADEVEWTCQVDPKFDVDFYPTSPFDHVHFDQDRKKSGKIRSAAAPGPYNYTVGLRGKKATDPQVIIRE